jgi:hypothetical protein
VRQWVGTWSEWAEVAFGRINNLHILAETKTGALLPLHAQFFPDKDIFLKQDALG